MILHTEAENVLASWSLSNKAISPYHAPVMRSNELHNPWEYEYESFSENVLLGFDIQSINLCDDAVKGNNLFSYMKITVHTREIITGYKANECTVVMSHFY